MELSKRLQSVVRLMPACDTVCDVGCDHGYVAITLIKEGIVSRVIAMDVNAGPLEQAKHNGSLYGVTDRLDFRLSDGLHKVVPGEAEAFLCAGMGGRLMVRIMEEGRAVMSLMKGAVLQPQSELSLVRRYIYESGWHIVKEDMILEEDGAGLGKFYPMMYIEPGSWPMPGEDELLYGPLLLKEKHPILQQYLHFSLGLKEGLLDDLGKKAGGEKALARMEELQQEIRVIRALLKNF